MDTFYDSEFFISSPFHALGVLVFLTAVLHLPFLFGHNLSKSGWKKVDYVWLSTAVLALLASASEVRLFVAGNWLDQEQRVATTTLNSLANYTKSVVSGRMCNEFELRAQERLACDWFNSTSEYFDSLTLNETPELKLAPFPDLEKNDWGYQDYEQFKGLYAYYSHEYERVTQVQRATVKSPFEMALWYFSPLLLCMSLAVRFTKVTGEVILEK